MTEDIVKAGAQHVSDVQNINKNLTEKTLRMRCLAYQHQVKSKLLIETIVDMTSSKKQLASMTAEIKKQKHIISQQNEILRESNQTLTTDRDLLELKVEERVKAYEKLAHFDTLTNLPNRFLFNDRLKHALARADREEHKVSLLIIDIDRFKYINDSAGHPAGDKLLVKMAQRLEGTVRADDTLSRLGGDEFAVVLEAIDIDELTAAVAEKIQRAMSKPFSVNGETIYLTVSVGISIYPNDADDAVELLKNSDAAMYLAKSQGKNQYQFYTRDLTTSAHSRFSLETQMRQALENNEFQLYYQPQIDFKNNKISGAEALIRWQHRERGLVPPSEFIWLAEETGFILELGEWVLRTACRQTQKWVEMGLLAGRVSVNLSPIQFSQPDIVATVKRILSETGCSPYHLEIEITESVLIGQPDEVARTVDAFKSEGIALAIDDFGTGYSSLAYLKRFQVDWLKIDGSFVRDVTTDANDVAIIRAIIEMGHALGLLVIAECVETEAQAEFLKSVGCDWGQGYLYGKPLPIDEFADLLVSQGAAKLYQR